MGNKGKTGCGCLLFILVICMVFTGALIHPFSLKLIAKQLRHADKVVPADMIFVHRFAEDKNGELYTDAFREYWAGNGKTIYVEEDKIFGTSIQDVIAKMAKTRGIKEDIVKTIDVPGGETVKVNNIKEKIRAMGYKKVIVLVPEYASKRFHLLYGASQDNDKVLYIIKPVEVSYFKKDAWWKDNTSRIVFLKEIYDTGSYYVSGLMGGETKK
ncbi:MAG: hypothetical protein C0399_09320 [Syntrophus sp. (in: bacteria)]|nr:hypothetical protein [Syntrophus sp. (in: bacteria)]